ncbi:g1691 [Coccomyxa viridis]|uniref:G1691 protein n=1 Tax=Coccomyxa viridis TaxID=1274662 RepID=A0ABP1FLI6_9CHLO
MQAPSAFPAPGLAPAPSPLDAVAPGPDNGTVPFEPVTVPWCQKGKFDCLNTQLSDNAILTALILSISAGTFFLLVFAIFRGKIQVFRTRLDLPSVWQKPPYLPVGGLNHLWSWLVPVITCSDMDLMRTAGMDSLMLNWQNTLGIQIFFPLTIVGLAVLLPVNLAGDRIAPEASTRLPGPLPLRASSSTFARLTISNLQKGSSRYWFAFGFLIFVMAYVCWLLVKYYQSYVILRQHYLMGGEKQINEWHQQFLDSQKAEESDKLTSRARSRRTLFGDINRVFNPNIQMNQIRDAFDDTAALSSGSRRDALSSFSQRHLNGLGLRNRQRPPTPAVRFPGAQTGGHVPTPFPHHQSAFRDSRDRPRLNSSPTSSAALPGTESCVLASEVARPSLDAEELQRLRISCPAEVDARLEPLPTPLGGSDAMSPSALSAAAAASLSGQRLTKRQSWRGDELDSSAAKELQAPQTASMTDEGGKSRSSSLERQRRFLGRDRYMGFHDEPLHGSDSAGRPEQAQRAGSGIALEDLSVVSPGALSMVSEESESALGRSSVASPTSPYRVSGIAREGSGAAGISAHPSMGMPASPILEQLSTYSISTELGQSDWRISTYETNPPSDAEERRREKVHRWWHTKQLADSRIIMGKPSVLFRKVVNTRVGDEIVAVNAQQYAVLVMDVPDLHKESAKLMKQAKKQKWWWSVWWSIWVCLQKHLLMRGPNVPDPRDPDTIRKSHSTVALTRQAIHDGSVPRLAPRSTGKTAQLHDTAAPVADIKVDAPGRPPVSHPIDEHVIEMGEVTRAPKAALSARHGSQDIPLLNAPGSDVPVEAPVSQPLPKSPFQKPSVQIISLSDDGSEAPTTGDILSQQQLPGSWHSDELPDAEALVSLTFKLLFPETFQHILPVHKHKEVDLLLAKWDVSWAALARAEAKFEFSKCQIRPKHKLGHRFCPGEQVDSIDYWAGEVRRLEHEIVDARKRALASPPCASYFVFFSSQKAAAIAAQTNIHPEDGRSFRVVEAPGPEEVNWPTLWMSWRERELREIIVLPIIVLIMLVPVGAFSGVVAQVTVAICGNNSASNRFYSEWYCQRQSMSRSLITSILPTVLLMLWQNLFLPNALYRLAQMEGKWPSLSSLDRRICSLFFYWSTWNVFLGAMLGGSAFSQLGIIVNNPGSIPKIIGTALPASSNFFINYVIIQGLAFQTFRLMYPHIGSLIGLFRLCGYCKPAHKREEMAAVWPHSIRYGREVGTTMLIFIMAMAYAATSPLILPFALTYFIVTWIFWRYNILYVSERCFESGGRIWDHIFDEVCWCLWILSTFTGCIFLANKAYVQATLTWMLITPFLYKFNKHCHLRYGKAVHKMPLEMAATAPAATVDPSVYLPPALRPGAAGWYPEYGKAWEHWNAPTYTL